MKFDKLHSFSLLYQRPLGTLTWHWSTVQRAYFNSEKCPAIIYALFVSGQKRQNVARVQLVRLMFGIGNCIVLYSERGCMLAKRTEMRSAVCFERETWKGLRNFGHRIIWALAKSLIWKLFCERNFKHTLLQNKTKTALIKRTSTPWNRYIIVAATLYYFKKQNLYETAVSILQRLQFKSVGDCSFGFAKVTI